MAGVGIVCKTPQVGRSKTRLHAVLQPSEATEIAGCFLRDVAASIAAIDASLSVRGYAVYAPEGSEAELRRYIPEAFGLLCRRDATLGVVLSSAVDAILAAGHGCALLVNSDSPTLPVAYLEDAIRRLKRPGDRAVLGPAIDGGYYLIGVKRSHPRLFEDIAWSTSTVTPETLARAKEVGLPVEMLPAWYDVDEAETLDMLLRELGDGITPPQCGGARGGPAVATRAFVARHPHIGTALGDALARSGTQ